MVIKVSTKIRVTFVGGLPGLETVQAGTLKFDVGSCTGLESWEEAIAVIVECCQGRWFNRLVPAQPLYSGLRMLNCCLPAISATCPWDSKKFSAFI